MLKSHTKHTQKAFAGVRNVLSPSSDRASYLSLAEVSTLFGQKLLVSLQSQDLAGVAAGGSAGVGASAFAPKEYKKVRRRAPCRDKSRMASQIAQPLPTP